jgi:hypothetical protein
VIPVDDLVTTLDVLAVDSTAATDFGGQQNLDDKRRVAVQDWLCPLLEQAGYPVRKHKTRRPPDGAFARTGGAWVDKKDAFTTAGAALTGLIADASADAIYVGLTMPFKGLLASMEDAVNGAAASCSITYWNGTWSAFTSISNQTLASGVPFARAGRITWPEPSDWLVREIEDVSAYWVRVQLSAAPNSGTLNQLLPIARSRLTYPVALRVCAQLYMEGFGSNRGEWKEKATVTALEASAALQLVIGRVVDEFDADSDGAAETTDVTTIAQHVQPWTWERG